jgi:flagellar biosynthetic protein FlhB
VLSVAHDLEERTEQPTPSRRRQAREEGKAARSRDLTAALGLLAALLSIRHLGGEGLERGLDAVRRCLGDIFCGSPLTAELAGALALEAVVAAFAIVWPLLAIAFLVAASSSLLQARFLLRPEAAAPRLARLSPAAGLARLFSARGAGRGGFAVLKAALVAGLLAVASAPLLSESGPCAPAALLAVPLPQALAGGLGHLLAACTWAAAGLAGLGALDWLFQRFLLERELRMSRRELLEELERQEGKALPRRRRRQARVRLRASAASGGKEAARG